MRREYIYTKPPLENPLEETQARVDFLLSAMQ